MSFKIGDRVVIRNGIEKLPDPSNCGFVPGMEDYAGSLAFISSAMRGRDHFRLNMMSGRQIPWYWDENWLKAAKKLTVIIPEGV